MFPQSARQQQPEQKHGGKEANQNVCDENIAINVFSSIFQRCSYFTTETPATVVKNPPTNFKPNKFYTQTKRYFSFRASSFPFERKKEKTLIRYLIRSVRQLATAG